MRWSKGKKEPVWMSVIDHEKCMSTDCNACRICDGSGNLRNKREYYKGVITATIGGVLGIIVGAILSK